jgi:hypothetical protein
MTYITTNTWGFTKLPYANISTKKNRLKNYDGNVYLEDGQEFEIELFNPSKTQVLAVIKLNGERISQSGIIVRPGERIWLERYLDKNNRFKFETYQVGTSKEVQEAIANNGSVEVEFFNEKVWKYINPVNGGIYVNQGSPWQNGTWANGFYNINGTLNNANLNITTTHDTFSHNCAHNSTDNAVEFSADLGIVNDQIYKERLQETGRVAEGSKSEQEFVSIAAEFDSYACAKSTIKILPLGQKKVYSQDIKKQAAAQYCTDCGTKIKATWKFCATCGKKI